MINFKEKQFGKFTDGLEKWAKITALPVSAASLAVSAANFHTNKTRHENDKIYQKQQLQGMGELTGTIKGMNKSINELNSALNKNSESLQENSRGFKEYYITRTSSGKKRKGKKNSEDVSEGKKRSFLSRLKFFSVEGGGFQKKNPETASISTFLLKTAKTSVFNSGVPHYGLSNSGDLLESVKSGLIKVEEPYEVNESPDKFTISMLYCGTTLVLYINNPSYSELQLINSSLNDYCRRVMNSDYSSIQVSKNVYVVETLVENLDNGLVEDLINSGIKVNILV